MSMLPRIPARSVVVYSKARAGVMTTHQHITRHPVVLVIEPQDAAAYLEHYRALTDYCVLPDNDRGIGYAQQWAVSHADGPFVGCDDDLSQFWRYAPVSRRSVRMEFADDMVDDLFRVVDAPTVPLAAPMFAGKATLMIPDLRGRRYVVNRALLYDIVAVNPQTLLRHGLQYDDRLTLFQDYDITLQVIHRGLYAVVDSQWHFREPAQASNPGGCQTYRTAATSLAMAQRMAMKWPGVVQVVYKPTRHHHEVKVYWSKVGRKL